MKPSVIVLAYNSAATIGATLAQAAEITDDLHVIDSFSSDDTVEICRQYGATVVQHAFDSYGAQRNWAIDSLPLRYPWQLHLDADERLTPPLIRSIETLPENPPQAGFLIARLVQFGAAAIVALIGLVAYLAPAAIPHRRGPLRRAAVRPAFLSAGWLGGPDPGFHDR